MTDQDLSLQPNAALALAICLCGALSLLTGSPDHLQAVFGTLAAVGAGLAAGGTIGGFLSRPDKKSPGDFRVDADPNNRMLNRIEELEDPRFGFSQFRRMANQAAGTADQTLQSTAAQGGSQRLGRLRQQAQRQRRGRQAFDSFRQFRTQTNQQANQLLSQRQSNQLRANLQAQKQAQRQNLKRAESTQSLFNNIAGMGANLMGTGIGGMVGQGGGGGFSFLGGNGGATTAAQNYRQAAEQMPSFREARMQMRNARRNSFNSDLLYR